MARNLWTLLTLLSFCSGGVEAFARAASDIDQVLETHATHRPKSPTIRVADPPHPKVDPNVTRAHPQYPSLWDREAARYRLVQLDLPSPRLASPAPAQPEPPFSLAPPRVVPQEEQDDAIAPPGMAAVGSSVFDPPIEYVDLPRPENVEDIEYRDGPRLPEPMVFDLVRGLGARRGEFEVNVFNLVPFRSRGRTQYEWAPEVEWAVWDGFALEFELPIIGTRPEFLKFAAQYTFGTAFDDAFIHGAQGLLQYDMVHDQWSPTLLYLAGMRLDQTWSVMGMFGFNFGEVVFPFADVPRRRGENVIINVSLFADITEKTVVGVETNLARNLLGSGEFLFMPQIHHQFGENAKLQFGYGVADTGRDTYGQLGFRVIYER